MTNYTTIRFGHQTSDVIQAEKRGLSYRVRVLFDAKCDGRGTTHHAVSKAGTKEVHLALQRHDRTYRSTLIVEGASLVLEIDERNSGHERPLTLLAIQNVSTEFSAVLSNIEDIEQYGYLPSFVSSGSVRESATEMPLCISDGPVRGIYKVSGYINPHEPGYITVRTIDANTGEELDENINAWRSLQYVGWSTQPHSWFFFQHELAGPSYIPPTMSPNDPGWRKSMTAPRDIRVEIWFHGTPPRKLLEATKRLSPWIR